MAWSVAPFVKVFKEYRDNGAEQAVKSAEPLERDITALNVAQMNQAGTDNTGRAITPSYTANTVAYKRRKGQPANRVTLRDTGDFHDSVFAVFEGDEITLYADDEKTPKLIAKYGTDVLGLDQDSIKKLIEQLRPIMQDDFAKKIRQ